jgi:hypothetical protein
MKHAGLVRRQQVRHEGRLPRQLEGRGDRKRLRVYRCEGRAMRGRQATHTGCDTSRVDEGIGVVIAGNTGRSEADDGPVRGWLSGAITAGMHGS